MKKFVALILSFLLLMPLAACGRGTGGAKLTPEEEYSRVYNLAGKGVTLDLTEVTSFEVSQKVNLSSELIASVSGGPTEETALMQYSTKGKGTAYCRAKSLSDLSPEVLYHEFKEGYGDYVYDEVAGYKYLWYSDVSGMAVYTPYTSYAEMINLGKGNMLYSMRNPKILFDPARLENFAGDRAPNGTYSVSASVRSDAAGDFLEWFVETYPAFTYRNLVAGENGTYLDWRFFDPDADYPMKADIAVLTTATSVRSVVLNITLMGKGDYGEMTVSARSDYRIGGVTVKDVTKE